MVSTKWGALKQQAEDATKPLPDDWYDVEVTKAEATKASTGSDMIRATFKVVNGTREGRLLWTNFVLSTESPFAMGLFFKNLGAFGLDGAFFHGLETADAGIENDMRTIAATLIGRRAKVQVGTKNWKGQDRNEVQDYAAPEGGPLGGTNAPAMPGGLGNIATPTVTANTPPAVPQITTPSVPPTVPSGNGPSAPPELKF